MKEDFFSKFKDYNRELEKILEKKDFSKDTKNLLLSMFYKLENSYNDYSEVKRTQKTKQEYLENILNNVKASNGIELINPTDKKFDEFKEKGINEIDLRLKKIKTLPNELSLLSAILELNNFQICLREQYNLIRNSFPYLLNTSYDIENIEVLRDFNAWSWNIAVEEIKDININLIYQNLKIALNTDIFMKLENKIGFSDVVQEIEEILVEKYNDKVSEEFVELIFKISIMIYINKSTNEAKRLLEEKETIETELTEIKNKKGYIEKITIQKKVLKDNLKQMDLILNNKDLLLEEYEKRNKVLSEYNKFFSVSHLVEKMQKERNKMLSDIEECNKKIEPQNYIKNKNNLEKQYKLLKDIKFDKENNIYYYLEKLQKMFIKEIFLKKIEKVEETEELINCMYQLRYYCFLPYTKESKINELSFLEGDLIQLKENLIKKMYAKKIINTISTNEENDIQIVKNIFDLKIINMKQIYIEVKYIEKKYCIYMYDEKETLEKEFLIKLEFNKKDKIKLNKKVKLFI